jgi:N-acetylmuramoyl-L-alanine amidase
VFLSIHHNSNAALDRDLNETQTYYPVGREGADLDLARSIHKYLVRNLEIEPAKIMAGNFFVLRQATVPAVLGEPAMLSHPVMEKRLTAAAKQELEAQAYFLGLLDYFASGTPHWVSAFPDTFAWSDTGGRNLSWTFDPGGPGDPDLDPATIVLKVDGQDQDVSLAPDGRTITWFPAPAAGQGTHDIALFARNTRGRATPIHRQTWLGPLRTDFTATLWAEGEVSNRERVLVTVASHSPIGAYDNLSLTGAAAPGDRKEAIPLPHFPGHRSWLIIDRADFPSEPFLAWETDSVTVTVNLEVSQERLPPGWTWIVLDCDRTTWPDQVVPAAGWLPRWLPDMNALGNQPGFLDPTTPVLPVQKDAPFWLEAAGALPIVADGKHRLPWDDAGQAAPDTFSWRPLLPDLIGKVVILDPTGGGSETDGAGPLGTRGADLNLRVAERTAVLLRGAGAVPILTRTDERWVPPEEKVLLGNKRAADLFLIIGRNQDPVCRFTAHHHYGSQKGIEWAESFAQAVAPLLLTAPVTASSTPAPSDSVLIAPSYAYLLRHTACPALQIGLELPTTLESEERLLDPSYLQATAQALFMSIAASFTGEGLLENQIRLEHLLRDHSLTLPTQSEIVWISLDGNFPWLPPRWGDPAGDAPSSRETVGLPDGTGEHVLEIRTRTGWQLWAMRTGERGEWEFKQLLTDRSVAMNRTTADSARSTPEGELP